MANFTKALKLTDIQIGGYALEFFNRRPQEYKADIKKVYKPSNRRSVRNAEKIINELMSLYQAFPEEKAKQKILDECAFSCSIWLGSSNFAQATNISLLLLTFPLLRDIVRLLSTFGNEFFTPDILLQKLNYPHESEQTKKDALYNALRTLVEVSAIKKIKKGIFKRSIISVYDVQGLEAILLTAQELGAGNTNDADLFLRGYSFEISHDFADYYNEINYRAIIPIDIWNRFMNSNNSYSLQYTNGEWIISNQEYHFYESNKTLSEIHESYYISLDQIKSAKNEKKIFDERRTNTTDQPRISLS